MIKNESLSDRLNEFKNNDQSTSEEETNSNFNNIISIHSLFNSLISLIIIFIRSFVFGYGLMTLLNLDWKFLSYLCVGFSIQFLLESFLDLIAILKG